MPMLDAFTPADALAADAEAALIREITNLVVKAEIGDASNERGQDSSWFFVHRPKIFVAGKPSTAPHFRFIVSVPEGQFDEQRRQTIVAEITAAVARAERRPFEDTKSRVWVIASEIPDGNWGSRGEEVVRLPEIFSYLLGSGGRQIALERLGRRIKGW
jgi:phenylpyruvate tautomerase PptA (4-oxalocrotonate tautomerase family)